MEISRRDLQALLPLLLAAEAGAQDSVLPSKCYPFDSLPVKKSANGMESRQVFDGQTHIGRLAMHITKLPPGQMPHPAHTHVHEEMMMIKEGTLEMTVNGKSCQLPPGSVFYVKSNELHGLKNVGHVPAVYFVLEVGRA